MASWADVFKANEDRGVRAMFQAMEDLGLLSYDLGHTRLVVRMDKGSAISEEAFRRAVDRALGRQR